VAGHAQQGPQAGRVAETHARQVDGYRTGVAIDDLPDVRGRQVGGEDVQFAFQVRDFLSVRQHPAAQPESYCRRVHS
jgi:hypothetical protein